MYVQLNLFGEQTKSYNKIRESRIAALEKIKQFLGVENVDDQFKDKDGDYYSSDKFIVSWIGYHKQTLSEFSIDKCDSFYSNYSGYKAIYVTRSLFHERQLQGFASIEQALIAIGLKLCSNIEDKKAFFDKYATKYNKRIQLEREQKKNKN